jgi:hypothetical protein
LPLLFNFVVYTIRKAQENLERLKLNCIHQLLVYADVLTSFGKSISIIKKSAEV